VKLYPSVSLGMMSGEARIVKSTMEYQEIAAFDISSPKSLNTFLNRLQFQVDIKPASGVSVDTWYLLHDGAAPLPCSVTSTALGSTTLMCDISGDMPVSIKSNTRSTYRL